MRIFHNDNKILTVHANKYIFNIVTQLMASYF